MTYDPNRPYGNPSDPYGQPADPYGPPQSGIPYGQPQSGVPYGQPQSGVPYGQPQSGVPYGQPQSGAPYNPPPSGDPYAYPQSGDPYAQPQSGQPYNPTSALPSVDPYANPSGPYGAPYADPLANPGDPYANPAGPYGYPGGQPGGFPPVPPPKKRRTGLIVGSIVAAVVVVLAVCSLGVWAIGRNGNDSDTSNTASSSGPSVAPSNGSKTPSAPATTDSRDLVQPAGSPYSFRLPTGFQSVTTPSSQTTGSSARFSSALATSQTEADDFLIVDAYELTYNADTVSQTELGTQFDSLVKQIGQDPSTRQNVTYNGNKGFWYQFDFTTSKAYSYFLFHGTNEIQVRCQWADQESQIKSGCNDLLNSLQITE